MNIQELGFRHLKAFEVTAELLNFRKASRVLNCSQPSLSRMIKELEDIVGFNLFERDTRNVSLLPQGVIFYEHLPNLYKQVDHMFEKARSASLGKAGLIRIGVVGTLAMRYLHRPLVEFRKAYPEYEVSLVEASSSDIVERLTNDLLECGFFLSSISHPRLSERVVSKDHLSFAIPKNHILSKQAEISLKDLEGQTVILFPASRNPNLFNQIVHGIPNFTGGNLLEASSRQMAILMAAAGFGIAVIGESMKAICPDSVVSLPLKGKSIGIDIVMGWRKGKSNPIEPFLPKEQGTK